MKYKYYLILILITIFSFNLKVQAVTSTGKVYQTTTNIKIQDILNNKVTSINVKRNAYNTSTGIIYQEPLIYLINEKYNISIRINSYDSSLFTVHYYNNNNITKKIMITTMDTEKFAAGKKEMIISVTDLKSNKAYKKKLTINIQTDNKSTESWNFQLNNSEGKNAKLIVKEKGKILQENKDYTLNFRYRDSQKCDLVYEVTPKNPYRPHINANKLVIIFQQVHGKCQAWETKIINTEKNIPTISITGYVNEMVFYKNGNKKNQTFKWNFPQNRYYSLKTTKLDSKKLKLEVIPIPITRNIKVFRNGEYYFGFYGKSRTYYLCLENNKWGRYIWCNEKNTETEKKNWEESKRKNVKK